MAVPAAAAGLAYLNAKTSFWYDMKLFKSLAPAGYQMVAREKQDRLSQFYVLEKWATTKQTADRIFIKFQDKSYTYAEVYSLALRYGTWFRGRLGVKPKDVVAVDFMNSDQFIFIWLGLWAIGAKPAFINYNLTSAPLVHCVKAAGSSVLLVDPNVSDMVTDDVRKGLGLVQVVVWTPAVEREVVSTEGVRYPDKDRSEEFYQNMAALIFTSGTTGLPKPAVISFGKFILSPTYNRLWLGKREGDVFYTPMPLYHSSAAILGFSSSLEAGITFAIGQKFSASHFWDEVRAYDATMIQYVGETCRYLLAAPPQIDPATGENLDKKHRVRLAFGNGLRPDVWDRFKDRFGIDCISEFYGATEAPLGTFNHSKNEFASGAVGRFGWLGTAVFNLAMAVVELDYETEMPKRDAKTGFCARVRPGKPGEMMFKLSANTERRFQGYYKDAKATNAKLLRDVFKKGDVWFRTGDTVIWDSEGRIYFTDRIGDTFRWKSENVSTAEVSNVVGLHPDVVEANVYGVELPHHEGRAGCAAVALHGNPDDVVMQSIADHVNGELPSYARPLFLRIMKTAGEQMTGTLKHLKHQLRDEGVDPAKVPCSSIFWLKGGRYVPFSERDWNLISRGSAKL